MPVFRLSLLAILLSPASALAQQSSHATPHYSAETILDEDAFRDLKVEARLQGPGGTITVVRQSTTFPPMIRLRNDFNDEIAASTDMIR